MPAFKDANGREWLVKLDGPKIRDVRKELSMDLAAIDGRAYEAMIDDPVLLVDALWVLCRSQAAGTTDVQFGEALVGDAIERATNALMDAITDFFPEKKRELIRTLARKNQVTRDLGMAEVMEAMNDPEMETKLRTAMKTEIRTRLENLLTQLSSATDSPAPSASVPTGIPSANSGK